MVRQITQVAITAVDRSPHDDDLFEPVKGGGVAIDEGTDVAEGPNGNEGDLSGVAADGIECEIDRVGVSLFWLGLDLSPAGLRKGRGGVRLRAGGDGDIAMAGHF